jgi:Tol biopolymer transport system component
VAATLLGAATLAAASSPYSARATTALAELDGRIFFYRAGGENGDAFLTANPDGSDEQRLIGDEVCCGVPAGDGSHIAFAASPPVGTVEILDVADGTMVLLEPPGTLKFFPGPFTPDGSQMAYNAWDEADSSRSGIYIGSSTDPSDVAQILHVEPNSGGEPGSFAFDSSPDGSQLVLYQQAPGDDSNTHGSLAVVNIDGSDLRTITPDGVDVPCCVDWSPDGTKILFADLDGRALTVNPDGSDLTTVLTPDEGRWLRQPAWSPDGSHIVVQVNSSGDPNSPEPNELWIADADGANFWPAIVTHDDKDGVWWIPDIHDAE